MGAVPNVYWDAIYKMVHIKLSIDTNNQSENDPGEEQMTATAPQPASRIAPEVPQLTFMSSEMIRPMLDWSEAVPRLKAAYEVPHLCRRVRTMDPV